MPEDNRTFKTDDLDLLIIGELIRNPGNTFKSIAKVGNVDQRTVARRVMLMKQNGVIRTSLEVDWRKLGVGTAAFVGCTTSVGEKSVNKLRDYLKKDPRVVEAYETVGAHQYFLRVLGENLQDLRDKVLSDLEPLTADLTATIVSSEVKSKNHFEFVRYVRETRYPKTRSASWG